MSGLKSALWSSWIAFIASIGDECRFDLRRLRSSSDGSRPIRGMGGFGIHDGQGMRIGRRIADACLRPDHGFVFVVR
jgi:hypothetical protein